MASAKPNAPAPWPIPAGGPARPPARPAAPPTTSARPAAARAGSIAVQVFDVTPAAANAVTLRLVAPGTTRAPARYYPGQFITLAFSMGGETLYRSYSLCGDGRPDAPWEITVKRQPGGRISTYLNQAAKPGMVLSASAPQGAFVLQPDMANGLVMVAGGSGITPIYGMLRALAAFPAGRRPHVTLHYAYRSPAEAIFARQLIALDPQRSWLTQYHYISSSGQRIQPAHLAMSAGPAAAGAHWYVCGPDGLRREVVAASRRAGVPAGRTHVEVFSSPTPHVAGGTGVAARIHLADSGKTLDARPGETLLETLERYGYKPEFSCRAGACGTCALRKLSGRTRGDENGALSGRERSSGYVLACSARPVGDVTLASADGKSSPAIAARGRHQSGKRALRVALVAATAAVVLGAWTMTDHNVSAATSGSSASSGTSSGSSSASGSSGSSGSTGSSGTSGSSGFTSSPVFNQPNTSTGVS